MSAAYRARQGNVAKPWRESNHAAHRDAADMHAGRREGEPAVVLEERCFDGDHFVTCVYGVGPVGV